MCIQLLHSQWLTSILMPAQLDQNRNCHVSLTCFVRRVGRRIDGLLGVSDSLLADDRTAFVFWFLLSVPFGFLAALGLTRFRPWSGAGGAAQRRQTCLRDMCRMCIVVDVICVPRSCRNDVW